MIRADDDVRIRNAPVRRVKNCLFDAIVRDMILPESMASGIAPPDRDSQMCDPVTVDRREHGPLVIGYE
jgi:hypothetical protein